MFTFTIIWKKKAHGMNFSLFEDKAEIITYFNITLCTTNLQDNHFFFLSTKKASH